jgi:integrase
MYGSGSIYQRASDGLWIATIEAGTNENGARRRITVSAKTPGEVKRKLRDRKAQLEAGASVNVSSRTTVREWANEWLAIRATTSRPKTYLAESGAVRNWIIPTIGHKRFGELEPADMRAVATAQRKKGRSSSTMLRTHAVLVVLLKAARDEGHPVSDRVLAAKRPVAAANDRDSMKVDEAIALLPWAGTLHHGSRWLAALLQGMRQAECLGLCWEQVDFDRNTIAVSWQLQALPYNVTRDRDSGFRIPDGYEVRQLVGALHLTRPKSRAGHRVIPMVPVMRDALLRWREESTVILETNPHGLVWPNLNGRPTIDKIDNEEWYALQQAAGIHHPAGRFYTIHEARHTTATLLLECGVEPVVIEAIMGHSSQASTKGYLHVRTERAAAALALVGERLQLS